MAPDPAELLQEAQALDRSGKKDMALEAFDRYLQARPEDAGAWADFGGLLMDTAQWEEAFSACETALRLDGNHYAALVHSGAVLVHRGRWDEAEVRLRKAMALDPQRIGAPLTLADCLAQKGDLPQARLVLEQILSENPDCPPALDRLQPIWAAQQDWPPLKKELARQIDPFSGAEADYRRSHLELLFGNFASGWKLFESRLTLPGRMASERSFAQPRWTGGPLAGKTLLLHWEQGFGDTLMFIRYAPLAKALGARVVVEVQAPLANLIATCPGVDEVVSHGNPLPAFDVHLPLMSLPALFRTEPASIPAEVPYLDLPEPIPNRDLIQEALASSVGHLRVGLAWEGNPHHNRDAKRSIPPHILGALAGFSGVAWHSFQLDTDTLPPLPGIISLAPLLSTFSDTAYALSGMDLVITVDTALAHLSGALGIPTWLLVSFIPDWRWQMGREDSPWYPTLRLFRQTRPGDWDSAIRQMAALVTFP